MNYFHRLKNEYFFKRINWILSEHFLILNEAQFVKALNSYKMRNLLINLKLNSMKYKLEWQLNVKLYM